MMCEQDINYIIGSQQLSLSLEKVKIEIAKILQIENINFLIGAGCSSHIVDGNEQGIPNMASLYEKFFEENQNFKVLGVNLKDKCNNNIEHLLELLYSVKMCNNIKNIDNEIDEKIKCVQTFLRDKICNGSEKIPIIDFYKSFYSKIAQKNRKNPINIFTTNYDLYSELALDELGFQYNTGFAGTYRRKFSPASYNFMYVENMNLHRDIWQRVPTFFNLIKLHGSISWKKSGNEIFEVDHKNIGHDETVMIYPTPLKDRSTLMIPYSDLFRVMENKLLQSNSVLIVLGYSFSDEHINRIIYNSLSVPNFKIIIFGNSEKINNLIECNDNRIIVINSSDKIHYFKNVIEYILPNIHQDIEEELDIKRQYDNISRIDGSK